MQVICPNCNLSVPVEDSACKHCGLILRENHTVSSESFTQKYYKTILTIFITSVLLVSLISFGIHWKAQREQENARLHQEHNRKVANSIARLRKRYPTTTFAIYAENTGPFRIDAVLSKCKVRTLAIKRSGGSITVNVGIMGNQPTSQAPVVWVTLYDEEGHLLARSCIVKFVNAELADGETREVEDSMDVPSQSNPDIVSIDEGGA